MNTGSLQKFYMDFATAPAIDIKSLMLFYIPLVLYPVPMTHVSTPASLRTLNIHQILVIQPPLYHWAYMLMTLYTSPRILR
jgi:hypothetical protein